MVLELKRKGRNKKEAEAERAKTPARRLEESDRKAYLERLVAMKSSRASWDSHYLDLSDNIQPRRSQFVLSDKNKGNKRNTKIINNTPTRALGTLASGIQTGYSNKSRPWFRFDAPTPELKEVASVKSWLHEAEEITRALMARSNIYEAYHTDYTDLGWAGTAALMIEEDPEEVFRASVFPVGQYYLAVDARGRVNTCFRVFGMSAGQLEEKFGLEACSNQVKEALKNGNVDQEFEVTHVIEENRRYQAGKLGARGKRWRSCWFESSAPADTGLLRDSGYNERPFMGIRWNVVAEDTYGTSPGMEALGDCRALQHLELRSATAFDKVTNPPMKGPPSIGGRISLLPGDYTPVDSMSPGNTFSPAHEVHAEALNAFGVKINSIEERINASFFVNLWLAMIESDGQMTAREVEERSEEKMFQLGPVVERLGKEMHDPALDRIVAICFRRGLYPPPPAELQGRAFKIEYISALAQAAKLIGTRAVERLASFVGNLAAAKPDVLDVIDFDQAVQKYADMLGVDPSIVRTDDAIVKIRKAVAEAKAQADAQQAALQGAQGAKLLSETDMQSDSALKRMMGGLGVPT